MTKINDREVAIMPLPAVGGRRGRGKRLKLKMQTTEKK
jgi:hypothetical protein